MVDADGVHAMKIAIIGAGLAGTSCAYVLKQAGADVTIYESGPAIAPGASGNTRGLYNPRLSAFRSAESDFTSAAFALALRTFPDLKDIGWNRCGSLHLITDDKRRQRFTQTAQNWNWPEENLRIVTSAEASKIAGIELTRDALWMPDAGTISPRKLCERYAEGVKIHYNTPLPPGEGGAHAKHGRVRGRLEDINADIIILANGTGAQKFLPALQLKSVRGQITETKPTAASQNLQCNLCYGGYITPAQDGTHMIGATFQRWLGHSDIIEQDDADNLANLSEAVPALNNFEITGHRAAVRTATAHHLPIVGRAGDNLYVSTAHGSHGILSSLMAAHLLADMILRRPMSLPQRILNIIAIKQ